jgi:hypothetical protein
LGSDNRRISGEFVGFPIPVAGWVARDQLSIVMLVRVIEPDQE